MGDGKKKGQVHFGPSPGKNGCTVTKSMPSFSPAPNLHAVLERARRRVRMRPSTHLTAVIDLDGTLLSGPGQEINKDVALFLRWLWRRGSDLYCVSARPDVPECIEQAEDDLRRAGLHDVRAIILMPHAEWQTKSAEKVRQFKANARAHVAELGGGGVCDLSIGDAAWDVWDECGGPSDECGLVLCGSGVDGYIGVKVPHWEPSRETDL